MALFVAVRLYPDDDVPEKKSPAIDSEALRFGCWDAAVLKNATSPALGVPPVQFPVVLKSVPVLPQVF